MAKMGDEIIVDSVDVGQPPRKGEILEVRGEVGHEHYQVRWENGHESTFYPSNTAHTVHVKS